MECDAIGKIGRATIDPIAATGRVFHMVKHPRDDLLLGTMRLVRANPNTSTCRIGLPKHRLEKYGMTPGIDYEIYESSFRGQRAFVIPIPDTED